MILYLFFKRFLTLLCRRELEMLIIVVVVGHHHHHVIALMQVPMAFEFLK